VQQKKRGVSVTCEVTPHHLYFDTSMITDANRRFLQMNPPLRGIKDRLAMIEGLKRGDIDYLATDHAPHTREEKLKGMSGVPHLDTYGPFVTWLMDEHNFSPHDIARVCSENPGNFVNPFLGEEYGKGFGKIEEGYAGNLTVIRPNKPITIRRQLIKSKCGWSPFEDITFPGRVVDTFVMGKHHPPPI